LFDPFSLYWKLETAYGGFEPTPLTLTQFFGLVL
jgi:hypothetical protein